MQLYRVINFTSDINEILTWQRSGVPQNARGFQWWGFYKTRGWKLRFLGLVPNQGSLLEVIDWEYSFEFHITRNSTVYSNGPFDILAGKNIYGPGNWQFVAHWISYMNHLSYYKYLSPKNL